MDLSFPSVSFFPRSGGLDFEDETENQHMRNKTFLYSADNSNIIKLMKGTAVMGTEESEKEKESEISVGLVV